MRTIVGLAIVIAVIWGLAWILRQVKASREGGRDSRSSSGGLASVAALTLGSGRSVHLVRAGNDYVLLGSTEHGVAPIHRYTEEQARDAGSAGEHESLPEQPAERSRLAGAHQPARRCTGRVLGQGDTVTRDGTDSTRRAPPLEGSPARAGRLRRAGRRMGGWAAGRKRAGGRDPITGPRPDPMRMPSPSSGLVERLRELTVRR